MTAAKQTSCATSSADRPLRSNAPTRARQYRTTIGRIVSSTSRRATRSPAIASATTASRRSSCVVIDGNISSVTNRVSPGAVGHNAVGHNYDNNDPAPPLALVLEPSTAPAPHLAGTLVTDVPQLRDRPGRASRIDKV